MKLLETTIYHVNHDTYTLTLKPRPAVDTDLKEYLNDLLKAVAKGENKREFKFSADETVVHTAISDMMGGKPFAAVSKVIAERFIRIENTAIAETVNLKGEIANGLLIQVLFEEEDGSKRLVISKADNAGYLGEDDLTKHHGLPTKKLTFRAFLVDFTEALAPGKLYVLDTAHLASYWWKGFLELTEVNTDTFNTGAAFDAIDQRVLGGLKQRFPADHNILKNRFIGYFKSNPEFEMDDFIIKAIGDYDPDDSAFDVAGLKSKIRELPAKVGFDSHFTLAPEVIKARRLRNVIHLSEEIDLIIKDNLKDYENVIKAVEEKGVKYIMIRTDKGYKSFKKTGAGG